MSTTTTLEEALALALKLAPKERLQLIERVASSVEQEIEAVSSGTQQPHWGRNLLRLLDELEALEMSHPEIEDPVEWVRQIRHDERQQRLGDWGTDE
jgi:hypothetical protein